MQGKTGWASKGNAGGEILEQLVKKGNQMHDRAIGDFFVRMVSRAVLPARRFFGIDNNNKGGSRYSGRLSMNHSPRISA